MFDRLLLKSSVFAISLIMSAMLFTSWSNAHLLRIGTANDFFSPSEILISFIPILLLSIATFFLRERVFIPWFKFTVGWFVITLIGTLSTSNAGTFFGPTEQDIFMLLSFAFYLVISLILILIQSVRVYWLKK
ncbi:hypothetical protein MNBD_CPR01-91 [hydrothermal vent metagenome]|uniref:Uncharacterized protein n=1 Tax=hydrothermal vent metagenome TaxID=652676 RepID=A0A3B0UV56_9ZZZZ